MNTLKVALLILFAAFSLNGCGSVEYIYVPPQYVKLKAPRNVPKIKGAFIRNECLWLDNHSTNLCGDDLSIVLGQIYSLRTNEKTCIDIINDYNEFVVRKSLKAKN